MWTDIVLCHVHFAETRREKEIQTHVGSNWPHGPVVLRYRCLVVLWSCGLVVSISRGLAVLSSRGLVVCWVGIKNIILKCDFEIAC